MENNIGKYDQESTINNYETLDVIINKYGENIGHNVFLIKDKICSDLRDILNERSIKYQYVDNTQVSKNTKMFEGRSLLFVSTIDVLKNYSSLLGEKITIMIITPTYEEAIRRKQIDSRTTKQRYQVDYNNLYEKIETIVESRETDIRLKTLVVHIFDNNKEVKDKEEKYDEKEKQEKEREKEEKIAEEMSKELEEL